MEERKPNNYSQPRRRDQIFQQEQLNLSQSAKQMKHHNCIFFLTAEINLDFASWRIERKFFCFDYFSSFTFFDLKREDQSKMLRNCARSVRSLTLRRSVLNASVVTRGFCEKIEKNENEVENSANKLSGFAQAFERHAAPQSDTLIADEKLPDLPFATLLRNSKLIDVSLRSLI